MDCMDCHNRPTHTFELPERALDRALAEGAISPELPFMKKKAVELLRAEYPDQETAATRIQEGLKEYYRKEQPQAYASHRAAVETSAERIVAIYARNVFPNMKVGWGTYPNQIGHEDFLGCFRCHDDSHKTRDGKANHPGLQCVPLAPRDGRGQPEGALGPGPAVARSPRCCSWPRPRRPALSDDDCLACHGDRELRSEQGKSLFVDATSARRAPTARWVAPTATRGSRTRRTRRPVPKAVCTTCHEDAQAALDLSVHAPKNGGAEAPACASCHGAVHEFPARADPGSKVAKRNLPRTCGACHASPAFLAKHQLGLARPIEAYERSVHGRALAAGDERAASCSDCHGAHDVGKAKDAASRINRWNVPATCGQCHKQIHEAFAGSIHGEAVARGLAGAPVCTDCHGEHAILAPAEPGSLVNPARVSSVTCGRCHGDERLVQKYNLPADKVPAFQDSFHGLAGRAGAQSVANCASCHGVHDIRPSSDPRSSVHPANLAKTCGACHPGAGERFAIGPVHVTSATRSEHAAVRFVRVAYLTLIPATLGFMLLHNGLDFLRKLRRGRPPAHSPDTLPRMSLHFRIAHGLVVLSFPVLVLTGFALRYPEAWWAAPLVAFEGSFPLRADVHRAAALLLCAACAYHVVHLARAKRERRLLRRMLPSVKDARDVAVFFSWALGRRSQRPGLGVVNYAEKMEYWAFFWGTLVMAVSASCSGSRAGACACCRPGCWTPRPPCTGTRRSWRRSRFWSGTSTW
jgi:thiosulfate reductase cytochrome b subunit